MSAHRPTGPREEHAEWQTLGGMILAAGGAHSDRPALRWKERRRYRELSFREIADAAREIGGGLAAIGIERGDHVAIFSNTRPEWTLADFGVFCAGAAVAPIYHTNSAVECRYILRHSDARAVFCEDREALAKIRSIRAECPALEHVVLFEGEAEDAVALEELRAQGREADGRIVDERVAATKPDDLATIVYTSGTTGPPKGCMLTHRNFAYAVEVVDEQLDLGGTEEVTLFMFLPLAHAFARLSQMAALGAGATLAYWEGDAKRILENIKESQPTHFPSVPRIFEKIYTAAISSTAEAPTAKRLVARWALRTGRRTRATERAGRKPGPVLATAHRLADRVLLARIRGLFGGALRMAITGAAPISPDVLRFFDAAGVLVLEGYGMTENISICTLNTPDQQRIGTVGRALPGVELRIADDGEVLMRGPSLFAGYFKDEEATDTAIVDGWLHTGDLGEIEDGFLSITGRKKDLIITSSGKNITPTNIEEVLKEDRWVAEAVVYGDDRPYLVALITLDPDELPKLAERLGVEPDPEAMAGDERVRAEIQIAVDRANEQYARIEQVKRFALLPRALSQAEGELTPTMKVKRAVVYSKHREKFDSLYE